MQPRFVAEGWKQTVILYVLNCTNLGIRGRYHNITTEAKLLVGSKTCLRGAEARALAKLFSGQTFFWKTIITFIHSLFHRGRFFLPNKKEQVKEFNRYTGTCH